MPDVMIPTDPVAWPAAVALLGLIGGLLLLWRGRRGRRRGDTPHCRRCDYALVGIASERCPECGAELTARNIVHGEKVRRPGLVWTGAALMLLSLAGLAIQGPAAYRPVDWYRLKPTGWVVEDLSSPNAALAARAWNELSRRDQSSGLAPSHRARVVDVALGYQALPKPPPIASSMVDWVAEAVLDGKLDGPRREKFFEQCVRLSLVARPKVALGDPIPYRVETAGRAPTGGNWQYQADREVVTLDGAEVARMTGNSGGSGFGATGSSTSSVPCKTPGKHAIGVKARVRVFQRGAAELVEPPGRLVHEREVTLTADTEVVADASPGLAKAVDVPALAARILGSFRSARIERTTDDSARFQLSVANVPVDVAFDVVVRAGGVEYPLTTITFRKGATTELHAGGNFRPPDDVRTADLVFRSSERAARKTVDLVEFWKGELVIDNVPVVDERKRK
jgi:hypothetical protein